MNTEQVYDSSSDSEIQLSEIAGSEKSTETTGRQHFHKRHFPVLFRMLRRMNIFLSITLLSFIVLYAAGNYQGFLDSNLTFILNIICINAIALFFFSFSAAIVSTFWFLRKHKSFYIFHLVIFICIGIFSTLTTATTLSITLLSEGFHF